MPSRRPIGPSPSRIQTTAKPTPRGRATAAAAKAAVDGIPALQAVVSANPKEAEGYFKLIERLLAVGDHAGAAATLQSLEQSLPDNPSIPTLTHLIGRPGGVPANL